MFAKEISGEIRNADALQEDKKMTPKTFQILSVWFPIHVFCVSILRPQETYMVPTPLWDLRACCPGSEKFLLYIYSAAAYINSASCGLSGLSYDVFRTCKRHRMWTLVVSVWVQMYQLYPKTTSGSTLEHFLMNFKASRKTIKENERIFIPAYLQMPCKHE